MTPRESSNEETEPMTSGSMTAGPEAGRPADRRRHPRHPGDRYPLSVGRHAARLVDWSAGSVGIQLRDAAEGIKVGDGVTVSIMSEHTHGVALFPGHVRRIDAENRILGIEFTETDGDAAAFLAALLEASGSQP